MHNKHKPMTEQTPESKSHGSFYHSYPLVADHEIVVPPHGLCTLSVHLPVHFSQTGEFHYLVVGRDSLQTQMQVGVYGQWTGTGHVGDSHLCKQRGTGSMDYSRHAFRSGARIALFEKLGVPLGVPLWVLPAHQR